MPFQQSALQECMCSITADCYTVSLEIDLSSKCAKAVPEVYGDENLKVSEGETCGGFFGGNHFLSSSAKKKYSLEICHQIFTTFFTLRFAISKEICHLVLILGAMSCNKQAFM